MKMIDYAFLCGQQNLAGESGTDSQVNMSGVSDC